MSILKQRLMAFIVAGLVAGPLWSAGSPVYPLKQSANRRYLVDQNNAPCLIIGESPQSLIVNLATNDAATFFANRSGHGFNTTWINLLCVEYTGGRADASTYDGILPFTAKVPSTSSYDLTTPNEAYFARADQMINLAAQQGIQVMLDPAETGGLVYQGTTLLDNGTNRCRAYGQYLGNRYKNFPNIIWLSGNDFQNWQTPADDAVVRAVALGIQDTDTNHLQTAELNYLVSSSLDDTNWNSLLTLNATYTYLPTYARLQQDYNRTNFLPNFLVEANYEFEALQGPVTTAAILRKQEYWTMTCGAAGQMYGNRYTWPFLSGWQGFLDTPGSIEMGYLKTFFEARAWYNLVPDTNNTVVTAGFGTFSNTGFVSDNDYLTAARTPDGSLAVVYTPVIRQFTVDMSNLSGPATTRWFDPSSRTFVPIAGSPFTNSGMLNFTPPSVNSDDDGGWVLVLETNPPPDPPPLPILPPKPAFLQQNYTTPQTPQTQVAVAYPAPQRTGNANIIAVGWTDTTASIIGVSDSTGNIYQTAISTFRGNGLSQAIYYAPNIKAGANTVTVTFNQPAHFVDLRATEYSGLAATIVFDGGSSGTGIDSNAGSGPVSVNATNELLFGAGMTSSGFTGPTGVFIQRVITVPNSDIVEDEVATTVGTYNATAAMNSGAYVMQIAAFKAAPGAPLMRIFQTATNTTVVAWPMGSAVFTLQQNSNVKSTNWVNATNAIATVGSEYQATISPSASQMNYRLKYP